MDEVKIGGKSLEQILSALHTQIVAMHYGNVFEDEAKGTIEELKSLYAELGGKSDAFDGLL